jgi:hypothetical protein
LRDLGIPDCKLLYNMDVMPRYPYKEVPVDSPVIICYTASRYKKDATADAYLNLNVIWVGLLAAAPDGGVFSAVDTSDVAAVTEDNADTDFVMETAA